MAIDRFEGRYFFLSNFFEIPVYYEGISYPSSEHAFQAGKTNNPQERLRIAAELTPAKAKRAGRGLVLRPDWEDVKNNVMEEVLREKFRYPHMKNELLATEDEELIEGNWWGDTYWGVSNGIGENHLGKILMKLRQEFREEDEQR